MKLKVATMTTLVIGMLAVMVGVFPASREAAIALFRGELSVGEWVNWRRWARGAAEPKAASTSHNMGGTNSLGNAEGPRTASDTRPVVADRRAEDLLAKSIAMLEKCPSVSAKTSQTVHLYGKHLVGSGEYLEQRTGGTCMFRVELKMQVGSESRTLLHVCDGRFMWRCEWYKGKGTAERVDLARAARALDATDIGRNMKLGWWTRLGGLSELLRDLRDWFQFTTVTDTKLRDQTPVLRLDGVWKPDRLAGLVPDGKSATVSSDGVAARLPEHLPDRVVLFLGREDLFPFRVEYRRSRPPTLIPGVEDDSATVAMDLFEATFNIPLNPSRFAFTPGNLDYSDQTDRFLERFGVGKKP